MIENGAYTQPPDAVRSKLRPDYSENSENLIVSSQVIATNF
ncbi:hexameric tyrosine-coordinated heme protein [Cognaticolwellia mytili]